MALSDYEWIWRYGGPFEVWINYADAARRAIDGLKPVQLPGFKTMGAVQAADIGPRGGMRIAHIHHGDDVYIVDRERWTQFTTHVMTDVANKLNATKRVSFERLMNIAATVQAM